MPFKYVFSCFIIEKCQKKYAAYEKFIGQHTKQQPKRRAEKEIAVLHMPNRAAQHMPATERVSERAISIATHNENNISKVSIVIDVIFM